jgi:hypothetical protein
MRKPRIVLPVLISTLVLICTTVFFGQFAESAQKEIKIKVKMYPDAPHQFDNIEVEGLSLQKQLDATGESFEGRFVTTNGSDWAKNIKFRYTNTSNDEVISLNVVVAFQHPHIPDLTLKPTIYFYKSKNGDTPPIKPGQSILIQADKSHVRRLENFCKETGLTDLNLIEEATIEVLEAKFANGSTWEYEGMHDPDPNNPGERVRRGYRKISQSEMRELKKRVSKSPY